MKKALLTLALLTLATPAVAAEKCTSPQAVATVDGMVCDFCAQGLIKIFKKNDPNVSDVKIDLTTKAVSIDMKPGTKISDAEIAKNVDYAGYKLVKVEHVCKKG